MSCAESPRVPEDWKPSITVTYGPYRRSIWSLKLWQHDQWRISSVVRFLKLNGFDVNLIHEKTEDDNAPGLLLITDEFDTELFACVDFQDYTNYMDYLKDLETFKVVFIENYYKIYREN